MGKRKFRVGRNALCFYDDINSLNYIFNIGHLIMY